MLECIIKYALPLFVLGFLAVPSLILAKKPNAKELFEKIAPYQGIIGIVGVLWGVWNIIGCIRFVSLLQLLPVLWILWLVAAVLMVGLGFILGYGLISKVALSKNEQAAASGAALLQKLMPLQGKMGLLAIIVGVALIVAAVIYF